MHDSVYEMAGDPRVAKALRMIMTRLADGPDGPLKEMADGVLAGNVDLREAAGVSAYGEELGAGFGSFWSHYESLDGDEKSELVRRTQDRLDDILDS